MISAAVCGSARFLCFPLSGGKVKMEGGWSKKDGKIVWTGWGELGNSDY